MRGRDLLAATVGALVALALAGGFAWAAIPEDGVIQGCYDSGGNLKVVSALPCPKGYTPLQWNQQGVQGEPGEDGADGADGTSPTVTQLATGDANCPAGGAAITDAGGTTAYVCSGQDGADGEPFSGTFTSPNGQYSLTVSDSGITLANSTHTDIVIHNGSINARGQQDVGLRAGINASLLGGASTTVDSPAITNVRGFLVRVGPGGACLPAARHGSTVVVDPDSGVGSVTVGVPTVCIG